MRPWRSGSDRLTSCAGVHEHTDNGTAHYHILRTANGSPDWATVHDALQDGTADDRMLLKDACRRSANATMCAAARQIAGIGTPMDPSFCEQEQEALNVAYTSAVHEVDGIRA